jgi:hypothetical protein
MWIFEPDPDHRRLAISGNGEKFELVVRNFKNPTSDIFRMDVGTTDKKFQVVFKDNNLRVMEDLAGNPEAPDKGDLLLFVILCAKVFGGNG